MLALESLKILTSVKYVPAIAADLLRNILKDRLRKAGSKSLAYGHEN